MIGSVSFTAEARAPSGTVGMQNEADCSRPVVRAAVLDEFSRETYCVLGLPIDVIDMPGVLSRLDLAAAASTPLFLSTPNLNYLVHCQSDMDFRDAMLISDLSPADGMPIVWLGQVLGVPIKERVAGSDIFAALKGSRDPDQPLKVFLFGGNEGVASAAARALNADHGGVECVGWHFPGFLSVEELSQDAIIDTINSQGADILVVCLGSKKGQLWLKRNAERLRVPIRAHLGAALNFEAGTVKRAPVLMQRIGMEWLWRIKEEPYLWRRYSHDGHVLLRLLVSQVLPLVIYRLATSGQSKKKLTVEAETKEGYIKLKLSGAATKQSISEIVPILRKTLSAYKRIVVDLAGVSAIDSRFLGLLLCLRKASKYNKVDLNLTEASSKLEKIFRLNGVHFLLAPIDRIREINTDLSKMVRA